jgi:hypothetical protein
MNYQSFNKEEFALLLAVRHGQSYIVEVRQMVLTRFVDSTFRQHALLSIDKSFMSQWKKEACIADLGVS